MTTPVAFLGLGGMGLSMAQRLLAAGFPLSVYNRTRDKAEDLGAAGAAIAASPAAAVGHFADPAPIVVTMLSDDAAVEALAFGAEGFAAQLPRGGTHVSCSTISVALSRRLAAAHAAAGQGYVAAPVLGRPEAAAAGKLFVLAAGAAPALAHSRPVLAALGQRTFELSDDPAVASTMKLVANFLITAVIESLGEGLQLAESSGVPAKQCLEVLTETVFNAPIYKTYGGLIAERRFAPPGFPLPLGLKDIRLVLAAAEAVQVPLPLASLVRDHMLAALARGQQDLDWSSFVRDVGPLSDPADGART